MNEPSVGELLYGTSLLSIEYRCFASNAVLVFDDEETRMTLRLDRVHAVIFRRSMRGPHMEVTGPGCHVHFVELSRDDMFLKNYVNQTTGLASHVIPFDSNGRTVEDADYVGPYHLSLVCSAGHLDVIADNVVLE